MQGFDRRGDENDGQGRDATGCTHAREGRLRRPRASHRGRTLLSQPLLSLSAARKISRARASTDMVRWRHRERGEGTERARKWHFLGSWLVGGGGRRAMALGLGRGGRLPCCGTHCRTRVDQHRRRIRRVGTALAGRSRKQQRSCQRVCGGAVQPFPAAAAADVLRHTRPQTPAARRDHCAPCRLCCGHGCFFPRTTRIACRQWSCAALPALCRSHRSPAFAFPTPTRCGGAQIGRASASVKPRPCCVCCSRARARRCPQPPAPAPRCCGPVRVGVWCGGLGGAETCRARCRGRRCVLPGCWPVADCRHTASLVLLLPHRAAVLRCCMPSGVLRFVRPQKRIPGGETGCR